MTYVTTLVAIESDQKAFWLRTKLTASIARAPKLFRIEDGRFLTTGTA